MGWEIFISTTTGAAAGSFIVLLINCFIKRRQQEKDEFKELLSMQISLHRMLALLLQIFNDYKICQSEAIKYFIGKLNFNDTKAQQMWEKYRIIEIRRFHNSININLDWNLKYFFSKNEGEDRNSIRGVMEAREGYNHFNYLLSERNNLINQALSKIQESKIRKDKFYKDKVLIEVIGEKLYMELISATNQYIKDQIRVIKSINDAYKTVDNFIKNKFPSYDSYELKLQPKQNDSLQEILKNNKEN